MWTRRASQSFLDMDSAAFAKALGLALKDPQVRSSLGDIVGESVRQEIIALRAELKRKDATIDDLRRRVVTLETSNDSLEQYQRRNSLRIAGFPEDENEDILTRTLELMNTTMSVEPAITAHDVDRIHRVGKKDGEQCQFSPKLIEIRQYNKIKIDKYSHEPFNIDNCGHNY
ncbi:hypothetical protein CAPTEDRAFT_206630 [Capitella teleta]|uniref:Uncharacterized protein n=1 Tax=Capitella teleta TaxID=283909 RepID=R7VFL1_CAPTE|nr:hypothetical protein CAPTEDRAFT_206630 [Capitella teleta]|eukprot:ELU17628.1 hypothetical protein CAPTEDRAFT_206630 [Capitella teleta]